MRMSSLAPPSPSSPPPPSSSRPLSETRTRRPPIKAEETSPQLQGTAAQRYLVDREFPSDEDFYSSDYESYHESDDWSHEEEEPDEKSHQIRPPTSVNGRDDAR